MKKAMAEAALQMGRIAKRQGVEIRLNTAFTKEVLAQLNPDEIIVATGSRPVRPDIPGIDKQHVVYAQDVLEGRAATGDSVAVLGGGLVGMETVEYLSMQGKKVVVIELLKKVASGLGLTRKPQALRFLKDHNIPVFVNAKCIEIRDDRLIVDVNGKSQEIDGIDSVVVAVGVKPDHTVEQALKEAGYRCHVIGDARESGKAHDAIWEGAAIGRIL